MAGDRPIVGRSRVASADSRGRLELIVKVVGKGAGSASTAVGLSGGWLGSTAQIEPASKAEKQLNYCEVRFAVLL
jgi:hypothetical protein